MLDNIKLMLGVRDDSKDELITLLIALCTQQALDYTHLEDEELLEGIIMLMVMESYNKLGSEGIESRNYSGISETVKDGYSANIVHLLNTKRKLRTV